MAANEPLVPGATGAAGRRYAVLAGSLWLLVAGVGSAAPKASMQVKVTVKVPAVANVTGPGLITITSEAPPPKVHREVKGVVLSGAVQVP